MERRHEDEEKTAWMASMAEWGAIQHHRNAQEEHRPGSRAVGAFPTADGRLEVARHYQWLSTAGVEDEQEY